jgi:DNA invertase Pin-like site-specific DNA recombinase
MIFDCCIRVSQVSSRKGERFISPSVQREQIEAWTSSHNAVLGEVFEELSQDGGRADRPQLLAAIERVESGQSDGLVVAKLDRFGRSLIDGLKALARIEAAGGTFVSVQDGIDISTPIGRLISRALFAIGEQEQEQRSFLSGGQ